MAPLEMSNHHNMDCEIRGESQKRNLPAPGTIYFTPIQVPPAGTALVADGDVRVPKLFQPLKIRDLTLNNRIMLSPMCQYSSDNGHYTMWHYAHIGGILQRGPGLSCIEATSVTPQGRITPEDNGLWQDSQIEPLQKMVEFAHSQGQKIMIQLAHAGRKASTLAPWLSSSGIAGEDVNGWPDDCYAPSAVRWSENHPMPKEMTLRDIQDFKAAFGDAVKRSLLAGFDMIEIHGAHGYLLHSFLSPVSNFRTDSYGGSFENRVRLAVEITELTRDIMPAGMPLCFRISGTDWLEEHPDFPESWTGEDTVRLAEILAEKGVDILDVSTGGNHPAQHPHVRPGYQAPFASKVKAALRDKLRVVSVGAINNANLANELLEGADNLDMIAVGRGFLEDPALVFTWAKELDVHVQMPNQIRWTQGGRGKKVETQSIYDAPQMMQ